MKTRTTSSSLIALLVACFALSPKVQAVVPAPDGGYPGHNTGEGQNALLSLNVNTGTNNTAVGWYSLKSVTTGGYNTGVGAGVLYANTANGNTAMGTAALFKNTTGGYNTANGLIALYNNTTGEFNTATGYQALLHNTTGGNHNTANGNNALLSNTSGSANTAMGNQTLQSNTTGSVNTALGNGAGLSVTTANHVIAIGTAGANVSDSCFIGNIWNRPGGSQAVYVNSDGKLGAQVSSRRFKDDIKSINQASEAIYGLRPVSFRYKSEIEPARPLGFGLIAEEVEKINPDLVSRDKDGKLLSVRYDQVNAMLLNEFLKEHRKVEEQQATITQLKAELQATATSQQKQIEALTTGLQKVSAQLEASKPAPHLVNNP